MPLRIVVTAVLALNAYLLSRGVAALTRESPARALEVLTNAPRPAAATRSSSAMDILRRNPFDSTTGPLDVEPIDVRQLAALQADPLRVPSCQGVVVLATAEFADPRSSTAIVRAAGERRGTVRRPGDRVAGGVVAFIGYNPLTTSPALWLDRGGELCQARLFQRSEPTPSPPPAIAPASKRGRSSPAELFARIQRLSPSLVQVDRAVVDTLLREYPRYTRGVRVGVAKRQGSAVGLQLRRIRPSGLLARLGFRSRDRIESVNGYPVTSPEAARAVLSRSRAASQIRVRLTRGDKPMVIELAVR